MSYDRRQHAEGHQLSPTDQQPTLMLACPKLQNEQTRLHMWKQLALEAAIWKRSLVTCEQRYCEVENPGLKQAGSLTTSSFKLWCLFSREASLLTITRESCPSCAEGYVPNAKSQTKITCRECDTYGSR